MHSGQIKFLSGFISLFLCWAGHAFALDAGAQGLRIRYISPLPDSRYILPGTNIIIRTGAPIGPDAAQKLVLRVTGARSGVHPYAVRVSDDGRTALYRPDTPFAEGEQVTVEIDTSAASWGDGIRAAGGFAFTTAVRKPELPAQKDLLRAADFPPSVSGPVHAHRREPGNIAGGIDLPNINVTLSTPTSPGYLFLSDLEWTVSVPPSLLVLRNDGTPVFARNLDGDAHDFKLQPNGLLTYSDDDAEVFLVMDNSGTIIDTISCGNGYTTDPHELLLLPNGHSLLLGTDNETVDMSALVPFGDPYADVVGYVIQELDANKNVVFQWRSWDHFQITDAMYIDLTASWIDYVHSNSLDVDTDGNILLSSRHQNEVTKIDRATGAIIWRLGGKNNQFQFINDSIGFSYQHAVRRLENGHITLFDNGDFHTPSFSRAVEYALDEKNMTATLVWQYRHTPDVFGYAMGYVQRMENGNTLIGWGAGNPTVTEVAPDGTMLYEMTFDDGVYSYRAFRFDWQPAVTSDPRKAAPASFMLSQNFPNPFNPSTTIPFSIDRQSRVRLEVFNLLGQSVATLIDEVRPAGEYEERFNAAGLASGMYVYRLTSGGAVATKKLLILR